MYSQVICGTKLKLLFKLPIRVTIIVVNMRIKFMSIYNTAKLPKREQLVTRRNV